MDPTLAEYTQSSSLSAVRLTESYSSGWERKADKLEMKLKYPGIVCDTPRPHHSETPLTMPPLLKEKPSPSQERSSFPTSNLYLAGNQHPNPTWSGREMQNQGRKKNYTVEEGQEFANVYRHTSWMYWWEWTWGTWAGKVGFTFPLEWNYGFECILSGGMTAAFAVCCFG